MIDGLSYSTNFIPVKKGIYFISGERRSNARTALEFYEFSTSRRKVLTAIEKPFTFGLALSPDGRSLLHGLFDRLSSNLILVENFR